MRVESITESVAHLACASFCSRRGKKDDCDCRSNVVLHLISPSLPPSFPPSLDADIVSSFSYIKEMDENITGDLEGREGVREEERAGRRKSSRRRSFS